MIVSLAATVLSGIWVSVAYTPDTEYIYDASAVGSNRIRLAHNLSVASLLLAVVAIGCVSLLRRGRVERWGAALGAGLVIIVATTLAVASGSRLAWQAVGVKVLRPGGEVRGVWSAAFDHNRWWVIARGRDVTDRYSSYLIAHLLAAVGIVVTCGVLLLVSRRDCSDTD